MILLERRGVTQVTFQDLLYPLILGFYELCSLDNLTQLYLHIYIFRADLYPKFYTKGKYNSSIFLPSSFYTHTLKYSCAAHTCALFLLVSLKIAPVLCCF